MLIAPSKPDMGFTDFLIIYLSCGAPFGVYHFVQNRKTASTGRNLLGALLRFILWIPFAAAMVVRRTSLANLYSLGFDGNLSLDSRRVREIAASRRRIEDLAVSATALSVFDCREVVERFIGLSDELRHVNAESDSPDAEIFSVAGHPDKGIASACLRRQIRRKLEFHLDLARRDLLAVAESALDSAVSDELNREISILESLLSPPARRPDSVANVGQKFPALHVSHRES